MVHQDNRSSQGTRAPQTGPTQDDGGLRLPPATRTPVRREVHTGDAASYYRIKQGDTLSEVAHKFNVRLSDIERANPGIDPTRLKVSQPIRLPALSKAQHTVVEGETISTIAPRYGVSTEALLRANPNLDPKRLRVGDSLSVPVSNKPPGPAPQRAAEPIRSDRSLQSDATQPSGRAPQLQAPPQLRSAQETLAPTAMRNAPPSFFSSMIETLKAEGGRSISRNDRAHQSGVPATNLGITGGALRAHILKTENRVASNAELTERINNLSTEEAVQIYASGFWRGDYRALGPKLSFIAFDWGVTSGPTTPIRQLQRRLGLAESGTVDFVLSSKIHEMGQERACRVLTDCRKDFYRTIAERRPADKVHLQGWLHRCDQSQAYALSQRHHNLTQIFERTSARGCDLFDPVAQGTVTLQRGTNERTLTRILQERLTDSGWTVRQDGLWGSEMDRVVSNFKHHYGLPGGPGWGIKESTVLAALQARGQPQLLAQK